MEGRIFNIQRFSIHDGPGIRTTVFFKGCHLRCKWCHNPESWLPGPSLLFYKTKCTKCRVCATMCKCHSFTDSLHTIDRANCVYCGRCTAACPAEALEICGRDMSAEDVLTEVRKDRVFYEQSSGGVSFSGGESLDQIDFILECLMLCKLNRFHTVVDTSGDADFSCFESLIPLTDLFLYDIKCANDELHKRGTGISNTRILENLSSLLKTCPEKVWIRVPLIPGFNADEKEMRGIREFLSVLPVPASIELLPYHGLGESKNAALGLEGFAAKAPSDEEREKFKKIISH